MYLYRFGMQRLPFGLTPDTQLFCPLPTHLEALNVIRFALNSGEGLIKLVGEVGTGKTMLCRLLLNELEGKRTTAYLPYPKMNARELKLALAKELGLALSTQSAEQQITQRIQQRLLKLNQKNGPVVLLIDEAQVMDEEGFETIRLFTNLETEHQKLLQIVLFGQPELDQKLATPSLRQVLQRIMFSYRLSSLSLSQVETYITQRISVVRKSPIKLSLLAQYLIYHYSKGVPRLVNILCHKALLLAFSQDKEKLTAINIIRSAKDTDSIRTPIQNHLHWVITCGLLLLSGSAMAYWSML